MSYQDDAPVLRRGLDSTRKCRLRPSAEGFLGGMRLALTLCYGGRVEGPGALQRTSEARCATAGSVLEVEH